MFAQKRELQNKAGNSGFGDSGSQNSGFPVFQDFSYTDDLSDLVTFT
jgi:hypothetical protein